MSAERFRALVVDDESSIRKLIAAALRKKDFDCDDVADGDHATRLVAQSRYDVVITDLKMPRKNGHALALELLQREDRPLVVIYTGVLEPRLAGDLLSYGVDDIVYKPADFALMVTKIRAMVERRRRRPGPSSSPANAAPAARLQSSVAETAADSPISLSLLNQQMADVSAILPVSTAAIDVYEMTRSDDWQIAQIAAAIQRDAALAADVLRLANSSLYNVPGRQLVDLEEAVLRVGQKRVAELALAANALAALTPRMLPWMDLDLIWKRSMAAGVALESLVALGGHEAIDRGLLLSTIMHGLGRVVLGNLFPKHYAAMIEACRLTGESLQEQERRILPTHHTEIMAQLLALWRVPADVYLPLKFSLDDYPALARLSEPLRTRAELVKLAIVIGRLAVGRWEDSDLVQLPPPRLLKRLRVGNIQQVIRDTRADLAKLAGFHLGGSPATKAAGPPPVEHIVPYAALCGNENDFVHDLLSSMGVEPRVLRRRRAAISRRACHPQLRGRKRRPFGIGGSPRQFIADY